MRDQTLVPFLPETLMYSHRLSYAFIDFERAQIFHESRMFEALTLMDS